MVDEQLDSDKTKGEETSSFKNLSFPSQVISLRLLKAQDNSPPTRLHSKGMAGGPELMARYETALVSQPPPTEAGLRLHSPPCWLDIMKRGQGKKEARSGTDWPPLCSGPQTDPGQPVPPGGQKAIPAGVLLSAFH